MYEFEWKDKKIWLKEKRGLKKEKFKPLKNKIKKVALLRWEEHCSECAPPECYESCKLYQKRIDGKCILFFYGIFPNKKIQNVFKFGADLRFRKWAKLETKLYNFSLYLFNLVSFYKMERVFIYFIQVFAVLLRNKKIRNYFLAKYTDYKEKFFALFKDLDYQKEFDEFIIECFSTEDYKFYLILEYSEQNLKFRRSFCIIPGINYIKIPVQDFNIVDAIKGRLRLYPENNQEVRIIFTFLNFVKFKNKVKSRSLTEKPVAKVKCVVWDLDNTLWDGILIESGAQNLKLKPIAERTIKELDARGIIQSIASKNDEKEALFLLEKMGIKDFFLYPEINWSPKSGNIKLVADNLNIHTNSIAFIDDSPFEREEVKVNLSEVRVYSEEQIKNLLEKDEFNVPITQMSKNRRKSYLLEAKRKKMRLDFNGDYISFLKNCDMKMTISTVKETEEKERCYELIQRTNQLNLSAKRYSENAFEALLKDKNNLCVCFRCNDKFGDYGIVGFSCIDESQDKSVIKDYVISCRVAQKQVEPTFLKWLIDRAKANYKTAVTMKLIKTKRNGFLIEVFKGLPLKIAKETNDYFLFEYKINKENKFEFQETISTIVKV